MESLKKYESTTSTKSRPWKNIMFICKLYEKDTIPNGGQSKPHPCRARMCTLLSA